MYPHTSVCPLKLCLCTRCLFTRFYAASRVKVMDLQTLVCALQLGQTTHTLRHSPLNRAQGFPLLHVPLLFPVTDLHGFGCPLELESCPATLRLAPGWLVGIPSSTPFSWRSAIARFGVTRQFGVVDSHGAMGPTRLLGWTPMLRRAPPKSRFAITFASSCTFTIAQRCQIRVNFAENDANSQSHSKVLLRAAHKRYIGVYCGVAATLGVPLWDGWMHSSTSSCPLEWGDEP